MATISKEVRINASADDVWEVIGDFATGPVRRSRRIVYAVVDSAQPPAHDNAVMQVLPDGADSCRFCWVRDILPDGLAPSFDDAMTRPLPVIKKALEKQSRRNRGVSQVRT
jgi:hypothetical protein